VHYGFDTDDRAAAAGALLIYAIYRSRDRRRYKVSPDMWAQIERFAKASAKRARALPDFIEALKPRLLCGTIAPRWMEAGVKGDISLLAVTNSDGRTEYVQPAADEQREFLTGVLAQVNERAVIDALYKTTAWCVLLVRDRLEREKPIESKFKISDGEE
jgi:hypothetical protein